ncbi:LIM domain transcription factor LMO4.2 isoform X2 [Toxorhynchites rutilus septentrionalis]|uniref:LIM domain transcription factor LMO4.2 isoform X2 n=1 Tax=Toxorhynchites rutilus septentrionalis TaxID=329112 RepID=UPI00247898AA|nr:LIM domain transcription factor LMO4.2 isoform X2 [Toxorhynchites rutilus septentrionalis]
MMTMDVTKPEPSAGAAGHNGAGSVASNVGPNSQQNGVGGGGGGGVVGPGQTGGVNGSGAHQQLCAGCGKHIQDRFLLRALDLLWHEDCLKCGCCDCRLGEVGSTLYTKGNLMLCKRDYLRLFGNTGFCAACNKVIPAFEMVMRARNNVYHLECFACQQCNHRFCVGDKFYLCENKILCEYDYEERLVFASMANHPMLKRQIGQGGQQQQQQQQQSGGHHPVQNGIGHQHPSAAAQQQQQQQQGQSPNPNALMSQLVVGQRAAGGDHNNNSNLPVSLGGGGPSPFGTPTHMKAALSTAS